MGITTFLNGGMGHFDHLCAVAVNQLKVKHPDIRHFSVKRVLIKPYQTLKVPDEALFDDDSARIFHSLRWATFKARSLTKKSESAYYVYLQIVVDGKKYYYLVDKHINDDIFEEEDKYQAEIERMISEWKKKKGFL